MAPEALEEARRAGAVLAERSIPVTAHGPLFDLNPGSLDPVIRRYTQECFVRGVEVTAALGGDKVVYHTCFNPLLPLGVLNGWKALADPVWQEVLQIAERRGVTVCLENSYESTVEFFKDLFDTFLGEQGAVCFDPAHVHLYSRDGQAAWMVTMGDRIQHIHLNDNEGASDDHLALGDGGIAFEAFLRELCGVCCGATVVLEMSVERAVRSLAFLRRIEIWNG